MNNIKQPILLAYGSTNDVIFKAMFGHDSDPDLIMLKDFIFALTDQKADQIIYEDREINPNHLGAKERTSAELPMIIEKSRMTLEEILEVKTQREAPVMTVFELQNINHK